MKWWFCVLMLVFFSCSINQRAIIKEVEQLEDQFHHHSGMVLYDPATDETLIDHDGEKFFTPASNTKILTLYTALRVLKDSIPALHYQETGDSLIFWGTGDPSLLYDRLPQSGGVLTFLRNSKKNLYLSDSNFKETLLGPGWAWDDYNYSFSAERTPLPIYGNLFSLTKKPESLYLKSAQHYFKSNFWLKDSVHSEAVLQRELDSNNFSYYPSIDKSAMEEEVPFHYSHQVVTQLLSDTLSRKITPINMKKSATTETLYSIPVDSAYTVMMQESDNFIAEQLLLVCAGMLTDTLRSETAINYSLANFLNDLPDKPVWVDGSGLSRYNLVTPRSMVWLWKKMYNEIELERLLSILAVGGQSGTLKKYYINEKPYIYGKTGTLSNNHNLSGFVKTKSGKILIFSFMHNNYPGESAPVKAEMEKILKSIHENY